MRVLLRLGAFRRLWVYDLQDALHAVASDRLLNVMTDFARIWTVTAAILGLVSHGALFGRNHESLRARQCIVDYDSGW